MVHQMASNNGVGRVKRRRMGIGHRMFSRIPEMAASPLFFFFLFSFPSFIHKASSHLELERVVSS